MSITPWVLSCLLIIPSMFAESRNLLQTFDNNKWVPITLFEIKGIGINSPGKLVTNRLGCPKTSYRTWGEDDGGRFDIEVLVYDDVIVKIARKVVLEISTDLISFETLLGIKIGNSRKDILARLDGISGIMMGSNGGNVYIMPVFFTKEGYFPHLLARCILEFNKNDLLGKVIFDCYGP